MDQSRDNSKDIPSLLLSPVSHLLGNMLNTHGLGSDLWLGHSRESFTPRVLRGKGGYCVGVRAGLQVSGPEELCPAMAEGQVCSGGHTPGGPNTMPGPRDKAAKRTGPFHLLASFP